MEFFLGVEEPDEAAVAASAGLIKRGATTGGSLRKVSYKT